MYTFTSTAPSTGDPCDDALLLPPLHVVLIYAYIYTCIIHSYLFMYVRFICTCVLIDTATTYCQYLCMYCNKCSATTTLQQLRHNDCTASKNALQQPQCNHCTAKTALQQHVHCNNTTAKTPTLQQPYNMSALNTSIRLLSLRQYVCLLYATLGPQGGERCRDIYEGLGGRRGDLSSSGLRLPNDVASASAATCVAR